MLEINEFKEFIIINSSYSSISYKNTEDTKRFTMEILESFYEYKSFMREIHKYKISRKIISKFLEHITNVYLSLHINLDEMFDDKQVCKISSLLFEIINHNEFVTCLSHLLLKYKVKILHLDINPLSHSNN